MLEGFDPSLVQRLEGDLAAFLGDFLGALGLLNVLKKLLRGGGVDVHGNFLLLVFCCSLATPFIYALWREVLQGGIRRFFTA